MKKSFFTTCLVALLAAGGLHAGEPDYAEGVFFLNEGWLGHQNGTINHLSQDGRWNYRVFQQENPGMELGCTATYGTVFKGRMYIISKQARDFGSSVTGGRITVCDAVTMKCIRQIGNIATDSAGRSIADGRAFTGIDSCKGYVSTSNGIYVMDLGTLEVEGLVAGSGGAGGLYSDQCGTMLHYGDRVFALHQKKGLLVIDAGSDTVVHVIGAPVERTPDGKTVRRGFGSIVQAKDGSMWLSVTGDVTGSGNTVDYFFRFDPDNLDTTRISLPAGYGLPNSWYSWTADAFCASAVQNRLYWKKQGENRYKSSVICCYDIDKGECRDIFDAKAMGWYMYCGAGFRLHPRTDEIYVSLYQDNLKQAYETLRLSADGELLETYEMAANCWFPAMPVFPDGRHPDTPDDPVAGEACKPSSLLHVYPNPTVDAVNVDVSGPAFLEVLAVDGRRIFGKEVGASVQEVRLGRSGVYFVRVSANGGVAVKRVIRR